MKLVDRLLGDVRDIDGGTLARDIASVTASPLSRHVRASYSKVQRLRIDMFRTCGLLSGADTSSVGLLNAAIAT